MSNASDARPPLSLGQLAQGDDPLLLPITPGSSVDEIARLVRESGASRVELLVPDDTDALFSADGARALRDAAVASGVRLTIFTADDRIAEAAYAANLDVFGVGTRVAVPVQRQQPIEPPVADVSTAAAPQLAAPSAVEAQHAPERSAAAAGSEPPELGPSAPAEPFEEAAMPGAATDDADFLARLESFDFAPEAHGDALETNDDPPRLGRSSEGALLFDAPGDLGVPRAADYLLPEADADQQPPLDDGGVQLPIDRDVAEQPLTDSAPKPSLLGALFGFLPARVTGAAPAASSRPGSVEDSSGQPGNTAGSPGRSDRADNPTVSRPPRRAPKAALSTRMAGNVAAEPRSVPLAQPVSAPADPPSRRGMSLAWLLVPLLLAGGAAAVWASGIDPRSVAGVVAPAIAPALEIEPPLRSTEAIQVPDTLVPLVSEPTAGSDAAGVQGIVLSVPVTVAVEGTAGTTTLIPFSAASGNLLFSNPSSQPITIPAGTPAQANGLEFTFDETVTVPGAVSDFAGTRNGQASARLTARLPGAQGNIPAGTITNIPGYTGGDGPLLVQHEQGFGGGSDAEVVLVTPDDVSRLLPEALTRLYAKGVADINAALAGTPGFELVQAEATAPISPTQQMLATVQLGEFEVFPAIGQVVSPELNGLFQLSMTRQFEALASPVDQPIDEQLRRAVAALHNREGGNVTPEEVQITGWRRGDGGLHVEAVITPRAGYEPVPPERAEQIAASIRGRTVEQARAELDRLQSEGLIGDYRLPDDWQTVPDGVVVRIESQPAPSAQP